MTTFTGFFFRGHNSSFFASAARTVLGPSIGITTLGTPLSNRLGEYSRSRLRFRLENFLNFLLFGLLGRELARLSASLSCITVENERMPSLAGFGFRRFLSKNELCWLESGRIVEFESAVSELTCVLFRNE